MDSIDYYAIFSVAFFGSFGHCLGMCGGIVLAYSSLQGAQKTVSHLLYNLGRTSSYIALGALFGALGSVIATSSAQKGWLFIFVGILMVAFAFLIVFKPRILAILELDISRFPRFSQAFKNLLQSKNIFSFYLLGVLNGFIPCGFVYFFALVAAGSASALKGALTMGIFGLATIPALFTLGVFASALAKSSWREIFLKLSAIFVLLFGIYTIFKGCNILKNPAQMQHKMEQMHKKMEKGDL